MTRSPRAATQQLLAPLSRFTPGGRHALALGFRALTSQSTRSTVLVPSFHCPSIVEVVLQLGLQVRYYPLNPDLSIDNTALARLLDEDCLAVLAIQFYGRFFDLGNTMSMCRSSGIALVEDCSHGFVTGYPDTLALAGSQGDVAIYSFWKTIPCTAVGGIRVNHPNLAQLPELTAQPLGVNETANFLQSTVEAHGPAIFRSMLQGLLQLKKNIRSPKLTGADADIAVADEQSQIPDHYTFKQTNPPRAAPAFYKRLLLSADLPDIFHRRQQNLLRLIEGIDSKLCVLASIQPHEHLWCLPVLLANRAEVDQKMRAAGCRLFTFGETLHPTFVEADRYTRENGEHFSSQVLCLATDHYCRDEDLEITLRSVAQFCT